MLATEGEPRCDLCVARDGADTNIGRSAPTSGVRRAPHPFFLVARFGMHILGLDLCASPRSARQHVYGQPGHRTTETRLRRSRTKQVTGGWVATVIKRGIVSGGSRVVAKPYDIFDRTNAGG